MFPELCNCGLFTLRVPGTSWDQSVFLRVDMMTSQGGGPEPFQETLHPDLPLGQALLPRGGQGGEGLGRLVGALQCTAGTLGERHQRDPRFVSSFAAEAAAAPSAPIPAPAQPGSASPPQGATSPEEKAEAGGAHAIPRRHAPLEQLVRQGSFRGFPTLSQNSPFKRQLSLRLNELPSTLQRKGHAESSAGEVGRGLLAACQGQRPFLWAGTWCREGGQELLAGGRPEGLSGPEKGAEGKWGGGKQKPQATSCIESGTSPSLPPFCQS